MEFIIFNHTLKQKGGQIWKKFSFGVLISILFLVGCSPTGPEQGKEIREYFPLEVGNIWVYEITGLEYGNYFTKRCSVKVNRKYIWKKSIWNNKEVFEIVSKRFSSDTFGTYYYVYYDNELRLYYDSPENSDSYSVRLREPLQKGNKWKKLIEGEAYRDYEVGSVGVAVEVPAGTFKNCLRVDFCDAWFSGDRIYAPGVGTVYYSEMQTPTSYYIKGKLISYKVK